MSALANHAFVKMNGLGNEIVVVDLRGEKGLISADDARAAARPAAAGASGERWQRPLNPSYAGQSREFPHIRRKMRQR